MLTWVDDGFARIGETPVAKLWPAQARYLGWYLMVFDEEHLFHSQEEARAAAPDLVREYIQDQIAFWTDLESELDPED